MFDSNKLINEYLEESLKLANDQRGLSNIINEVSLECIKTIEAGGKLIFMGNGGSASDSLHLAAELIGRFQQERNALPALSISSNVSIITALANDYGYENIFTKQIEGIAKENDLIIGISTSGKSENILKGLKYAKDKKIKTVGLTGENLNKMTEYCDYVISVPSSKPALIQQSHITIGQLLCLIIEDYFFNK
jgi:D-sedoheptulose 7-phosphate isomerase